MNLLNSSEVLNERDKYYFDLIRNLNYRFNVPFKGRRRESRNIFDHFLKYDKERTVFNDQSIFEEYIEALEKKINQEIFGREERNYYRRYGGDPIRWFVKTAFRIENRKKYITELEKLRNELIQMQSKPNSKSRKKELKRRIEHLGYIIEDHQLGVDNLILGNENWWRFNHKHNRDNSTRVEYMPNNILMNHEDKYLEVIDLLEREGVPNMELFRNLTKQTEVNFFRTWKNRGLVPAATIYMLSDREKAIEDVIRRIPSKLFDHGYDMIPNPSLESVLKDSKVILEFKRLGLPLEITTNFFQSWEDGRNSQYDEYGLPFLKGAKNFYLKQLKYHDNPLLKWIGANALISIQRNKISHKKKFTHLETIIKALNLETKYPNLTQRKEVLAERFLRLKPYKIENTDPFELEGFDKLCSNEKRAIKTFDLYGAEFSLFVFTDKDYISGLNHNLEETLDILESEEFRNISENKYFRKFLSQKFNLIESLKNRPSEVIKYLIPLRTLSLDLEKYETEVSKKDLKEITDLMFNRRGFNSLDLKAYQLYREYLGKSFNQFVRDFKVVGDSLSKIPNIKKTYSLHLDEDRLKAMLNYVTKKRNRDLIDALTNLDDHYKYVIFKRLDEKVSKKDLVKTLFEASKTYSLLNEVRQGDYAKEEFDKIGETLNAEEMQNALIRARNRCYENVIGEGNIVPKHLEGKIDNVLFAFYNGRDSDYYYSSRDDIKLQEALRLIATGVVTQGPQVTFEQIRNLEENLRLRNKYREKGIDIDLYEEGIQREFLLTSDDNYGFRLKEKIDDELSIIYNRLSQIGIDISQIHRGKIIDQLGEISSILKSVESTKENLAFKEEIKGHINTIRSINGISSNTVEDNVIFYVSQDPLESLHMGQFFGSCLSLTKNHEGINGWASIVQTMNSNMNVIYAKGTNDNYVGRNRTVLTDKGIVCTRFYSNGRLATETAWIEYLTDYSRETGQKILIPEEFTPSLMRKEFNKKRVKKVEVQATIEPAYFSKFYSDGLNIERAKEGRLILDTTAYEIIP